jgi:hypothetical protein
MGPAGGTERKPGASMAGSIRAIRLHHARLTRTMKAYDGNPGAHPTL